MGGPSYRQVVSLCELEDNCGLLTHRADSGPFGSLFINPVGQSGNLLSPHYDNLTKMWGTGEYLEMTLRTTPAQLKGDPPQYKQQCEPDMQ